MKEATDRAVSNKSRPDGGSIEIRRNRNEMKEGMNCSENDNENYITNCTVVYDIGRRRHRGKINKENKINEIRREKKL